MQETCYRIHAPLRRTIALLADLHDRPCGRILSAVARKRPDLIAVPGDFLWGGTEPGNGLLVEASRRALPFLRDCAALAPTFVSLGNHEQKAAEEDLLRIRETGAVLLDNAWVSPEPGLHIGGLTSAAVLEYRAFRAGQPERYPPHGRHPPLPPPDLSWLPDFEALPGYRILLCHHPEYLPRHDLARRDIQLILSGHAHGGQIRLFGRGLFAPGQGFFPAMTRGIYGPLVLSAGLSNTARPIPRLGNPREIVYVELGSFGEIPCKILPFSSNGP